jgi:hypothetical protein
MARRKISIEEAFAALEAAGINVQVKSVDGPEPVPVPAKPKLDYTQYPPVPIATVSPDFVKIPLYARHTVGSGGYTVTLPDGSEQIQSAGVESYGPGLCTVPAELASHLLYQDSLAKQADQKMLDRTEYRYLVAEVQGAGGIRANIGYPVTSEMFDDVSKWPAIVLRGNG